MAVKIIRPTGLTKKVFFYKKEEYLTLLRPIFFIAQKFFEFY